jgi:DNA-binding NarL/FixJ family response regulator
MATPARIRISLVEDDPVIRESLAELIASDDRLQLVQAHPNGGHALEQVPRDRPDVVLMDISMPVMDGIECVARLSAVCRTTQFLMYTMHDDDQRVFEALKAGANGYILKSSTPDQILEAIVDLQRGGAPMSTSVARRVVAHFRAQEERSLPADHGLSDREHLVLELLAQGLLYKEIADRIGVQVGTVKQHIHRLYTKLHVNNRTEAVNRWFGR